MKGSADSNWKTLVGAVTTIKWNFPRGIIITLPLEFNLPSHWNPNLGVTRIPHF